MLSQLSNTPQLAERCEIIVSLLTLIYIFFLIPYGPPIELHIGSAVAPSENPTPSRQFTIIPDGFLHHSYAIPFNLLWQSV